MFNMVISKAEAELLLHLLHIDDTNSRDNGFPREEVFEELEAKLVAVIFENK